MFCCKPKDEEQAGELRRDKEVQKQLDNYSKKDERDIKLLLLGAGSSGKSTIFKQIRVIHNQGFTPTEFEQYKEVVYENVFACVMELARGMNKLGIPWENSDNQQHAERICSTPKQDLHLTPELGRTISRIWSDAGIKRVYDRRSEIQLYDSCEYYMTELDRISSADYQVTENDIIRARLKTVGIVERSFTINEYNFRIVDVGGQRNERRKWIHAFDNVTAVIFVVALSEYDQRLVEDSNMNRMIESETLFNDVCNNRWFRNRAVIIFFNKEDLFNEKIKSVNLSVCYPEYTGGLNRENALNFITERFKKANANPERTIYTHITTATSTHNIKVVFTAVKGIIIEEMLRLHAIL